MCSSGGERWGGKWLSRVWRARPVREARRQVEQAAFEEIAARAERLLNAPLRDLLVTREWDLILAQIAERLVCAEMALELGKVGEAAAQCKALRGAIEEILEDLK